MSAAIPVHISQSLVLIARSSVVSPLFHAYSATDTKYRANSSAASGVSSPMEAGVDGGTGTGPSSGLRSFPSAPTR